MALLSLQNIGISFSGPSLLEDVNMQVEKGERVCLLGRNGEGKTTLLKIISGAIQPDSGTVVTRQGSAIAGITQELPSSLNGSTHDVVAGGLGRVGILLEEYHRLTNKLSEKSDADLLKQMDVLQEQLEAEQGWQIRQNVETVLSRLSLNPEDKFETLSVGFKRRVLLARALVAQPDILLLDEPTNHLDIAAIEWMEEFLNKYDGTVLFVTHDRIFLQRLATRIIEIDRARLLNWECGYTAFLERRQAVLDNEEVMRDKFDKRLAKEEEWIRKGVKARRTRNEGRVKFLLKMREDQQARRKQAGSANIRIQEAESAGKLVVEAFNVTHGYKNKPVINDFSIRITRGDRIGIIGPNGIGKSTLLKILLGVIEPDQGKVKNGARQEVVYFDQLREQLNEDMTVQENIADGNDTVTIDGRQRHVIGYLKDFLFSADRARSPVRILSGGERNRLLLARLFTRSFNVLVLDEPTNDLDVETLELLEDRLLEYSGTLLLVSHDREFLNNVVTSTLVFEGDGLIREYAGGYDDWIRQRPRSFDMKGPDKKEAAQKQEERKKQIRKERSRKLTFKEGRELESLPGLIEALEKEQGGLYKQTSDPDYYKKTGDEVSMILSRIEEVERELGEAYERWEELEAIREAGI